MAEMTSPPESSPCGSALRRNWVWLSIQVVLRIIFSFWLRYRARGVEGIPARGGALLLGNHASFIDPLLVGLPLHRPVSFLARDTLFRVPVIGWILRHTYVMPLARDTGGAAGIRETLRRLEEGFLVGIFPEGTRSADGTLGPFKPGFAALVRRTDLPIYPVGIAGAHRAMGRGSLVLKPHRVCVVFGEPFPQATIATLRQRGREEELMNAVRARIGECQREAEAWLKR
jgi:1-acyl-sn-glycerol-3-phosphate acyltransferase